MFSYTCEIDTLPTGRLMRSYFPTTPTSKVIYCFHGSGGSAEGFATKSEMQTVLEDGLVKDYGFVFIDSYDRVNKKWVWSDWHDIGENGSVYFARIYCEMRNRLPVGSREFALGMSNGGGFAPHVAHHYGMKAAAVYCASGHERLLNEASYNRPVVFIPGEIDTTVPLREVEDSYRLLKRKQILTELHTMPNVGHDFSAIRRAEMYAFFDKC
jgi:predicted esterase